jgi:hypothetical protein
MIKLLNYTMPLTGDDSHHYDHLTKGWEVATTTTTTSHMEGHGRELATTILKREG